MDRVVRFGFPRERVLHEAPRRLAVIRMDQVAIGLDATVEDIVHFVDDDTTPFDTTGHGTHVASTIAEDTNNRFGLTGLAYGARLMPVRVLDSQGRGDVAAIANGIRNTSVNIVDASGLREYYDPYTGRGMGASAFAWSSLIMEVLEPDPRALHSFVAD